MFTPNFSSAAMFHRKGLLPVINADKTDSALKHPAPKAPRVFADSATRSDIEPLLRAGIINGITTNPSLLKKAGEPDLAKASLALLNDFRSGALGRITLETVADLTARA